MTSSILFISLLIGTVLAEIVFRTFAGPWLRGHLREIGALLHTFQESEGDDARQALLLRSGRTTLKFSLVLLVLLIGLTVIACLAPWVLRWTESQRMEYLLASSVSAMAWWVIRNHRRDSFLSSLQSSPFQSTLRGNPYGMLERWLHWLALEPSAVRHLTFDLERQFALPKHPVLVASSSNKAAGPADGAVYVCGLARSGTTMLLRILDEITAFRSLTYRAMPFVLAPNLWKLVTRHARQQSVLSERAHGDGIHVDLNSPEGFEEVFWRTFDSRAPDPRCFNANEPSSEVLATFADYRALVSNPRTEPSPVNGIPRRYLSKNNNNLLRLSSLSADPTATVLLVYRDPVATARSLHRQHLRFCAIQAEDHFTRVYMGWLAHHEFGLDHRPFCFALPEMDSKFKPEDLNYWLDYWNAVYCHILAQVDLRLLFVNHDSMCTEPVRTLEAIFDALGVKADAAALAKLIAIPSPIAESAEGFCPELLSRAEVTFRMLMANSKNL